MTIGVGLAPINKKHTADLAKKIELFMNLGVSSFSLLFDDIEQEFSLSEQLELFKQTKTKYLFETLLLPDLTLIIWIHFFLLFTLKYPGEVL